VHAPLLGVSDDISEFVLELGGGISAAAPAHPCATPQCYSRWPPETRICLAASTGCLLLGYDTGVIAGAILLIIPEFALENRPELIGLVVSSCIVGALVGALLAGPSADIFGRRPPLLAAGLLFMLGGAAMGWSPCFEVLIAGRFVAGLGIGAASSTVPVYIAECAAPASRGALSTLPQLLGSSGILLSYLIAICVMLIAADWRCMLLFSLPLAALQTICACFLPETPRWLLGNGRINDARLSLARLRTRNAGGVGGDAERESTSTCAPSPQGTSSAQHLQPSNTPTHRSEATSSPHSKEYFEDFPGSSCGFKSTSSSGVSICTFVLVKQVN
jgi:MFS family permease